MPRPPSDEQFTEFVHATWPSLYRTAYLLIGDRAEAEDLVQTALAKTYASWGKVRELEAAPGYARTTLVNTATSWFRRRSWRNERPTEHLPDIATSHDPSDRPALMDARPTWRLGSEPSSSCATTRTSAWLRRLRLSTSPRAPSRARPPKLSPAFAPSSGNSVVPHTLNSGSHR